MHAPTAPDGRRAADRGVVVPGGRGARPPAAQSSRPVRPAWTGPAGVGAVVAAATVVLATRSPHVPGSYGSCPFLSATGLWCPVCGGLRAVHELAHLDVAGAWEMNPLVVLAVPVAVVAWVVWLARSSRGRGAPRLRSRGAWAGLGVVLAFTVARNLPALEPWLAPGGPAG